MLPSPPKMESAESHLLRTGDGRTTDERVSFHQSTNPKGSRSEKRISVKEGETVSSLIQKHYGWVNPTLIKFVLDFNPEITNANLIHINQTIRFQKITEQSLILTSLDLRCKIHAGTFRNQDASRLYTNEPALNEKEIEVIPLKVLPQETWYQVIIGNFEDKKEPLGTVRVLKEKRLLPSLLD